MSESIWVKSTNHSSIIQNEYSHIFYTILSIITLPLSQVFSQSRKLWWFSRNNGLWPRLRCRIAGVEIPGRHLGTISTLARKSGIYFITVSPSPCTKWKKIPTTSEQSVLRFQSLPSLLVTMTVVGVLDTFPLMPGTDHIPIVFLMSGSWFCDTFCVSHCHRYVETGAAGSSDTGGPANYCGPVKIW